MTATEDLLPHDPDPRSRTGRRPFARAGHGGDPLALWHPRWDGRPGRLEVWYATMTDAATGAGFWVHGETVAPSNRGHSGAGPIAATSHGWAALFPPDGDPVWARTAATQVAEPHDRPDGGFTCEGASIGADGTRGNAGELEWDLRWSARDQTPLWTFPRWTWRRELLPASQTVPAPCMVATGWVRHGERRLDVEGHAQAARIYGHGNAQRWAWLHADLGGGDVIELVSAVSTRSLLRSLPPVTFLRMRVGGVDLPRQRIACWGLRTHLDLPRWTVSGSTQGLTVDLEVVQPPQRCVSIDYADPDGATATCTNTEQADMELRLEGQDGRTRTWSLQGTAHAEVGRRP